MCYLPICSYTKDQLLGLSTIITVHLLIHCCTLSYEVMVFKSKSYYSKIKKSKVPCHAFSDNILVEWSARELWQLATDNLGD